MNLNLFRTITKINGVYIITIIAIITNDFVFNYLSSRRRATSTIVSSNIKAMATRSYVDSFSIDMQ
jgi:hypothetical protein